MPLRPTPRPWRGALLWGALAGSGCLLGVPPLLDDNGPAPTDCEPGQAVVCYSGPEGTQGQGICSAGQGVCGDDGMTVESCVGEQLPETEICRDDDVDEDCDGEVNDHCALWSKSFGGSGADRVQGLVANDDGVILGGDFANRIDFGGGELMATSQDGFVASLDAAGDHQWTVHLEGSSGERVDAVTRTASQVVASGRFGGNLMIGMTEIFSGAESDTDCLIMGLDPADGSLSWLEQAGDTSDCAAVAVTANGDTAIVGMEFDGDITLPTSGMVSAAGDEDLAIVAYDDMGTVLWDVAGGGADDEEIWALAVDGGALYVAGKAGPGLDLGCTDPIEGDDDGDGFLAKMDASDGSCTWVMTFAGTGRVRARAMDARGGRVFVGLDYEEAVSLPDGSTLSSNGELDMAVLALDADGDLLWSRAFGDAGKQEMWTASAGAEGVLVGGSTSGSPDLGEGPITTADLDDDAFAIRLDGDGEVLWARSFGGDGDDDIIVADLAPDGSLYVGGEVFITMDLGLGPISGDVIDAFAARLKP